MTIKQDNGDMSLSDSSRHTIGVAELDGKELSKLCSRIAHVVNRDLQKMEEKAHGFSRGMNPILHAKPHDPITL